MLMCPWARHFSPKCSWMLCMFGYEWWDRPVGQVGMVPSVNEWGWMTCSVKALWVVGRPEKHCSSTFTTKNQILFVFETSGLKCAVQNVKFVIVPPTNQIAPHMTKQRRGSPAMHTPTVKEIRANDSRDMQIQAVRQMAVELLATTRWCIVAATCKRWAESVHFRNARLTWNMFTAVHITPKGCQSLSLIGKSLTPPRELLEADDLYCMS